MADPQTHNQGVGIAPETPILAPERTEGLARIESEPLQTSIQERAGVSLTVLEQNLERQRTLDRLKSIDVHKTYEEQKEEMMLLEDVLWPVIIKSFDAGYTIDRLSDVSLIETEKLVNMNGYEQPVALEILQSIAASPESELASTWPFESFVSEHRSNFETASVMKNFNTRVEPVLPSQEGKPYEASKMRTAWEFTKDHPWLVAFGVTVGYYGVARPLWRTVKSWFQEPEEKKEEAKDKKKSGIFKWAAGGVAMGGALALGAMFAPDSFRRFIRDNLHINWSGSSLWEFLTVAWKEKSISKAMAVFRKGVVEIDTASRAVASKIDADAEKIAFLRKAKYTDFMSEGSQLRTVGKDIGNSLLSRLCPEWDIPFLTDKDELSRQIDTEKKLHAFFSDSKIKTAVLAMNLGENATVGDILDGLTARGFFGAAAQNIAEEEQQESQEVREEADVDDYSLIGDSASIKRIAKYLESWGATKTIKILKDFSENKYEDRTPTFLWDLATAFRQDDLTLVKDGSHWTLAKETVAGTFDFVVLGSFEALGDLFVDVMRAQYDDNLDSGDVAVHYFKGVSGYMLVFGLAKGVFASYSKWSHGFGPGFLRGATSGAIEGSVLPFTMAKYGVRTAREVRRTGQEFVLSRGIRVLEDELRTVENQTTDQAVNLKAKILKAKLEKLDFYAEIYKKYNERLEQAEASLTEGHTSIAQKTWAKIYRSRHEQLLKRYENKFIREWNNIKNEYPTLNFDSIATEIDPQLNRLTSQIQSVKDQLLNLRNAEKAEYLKTKVPEIQSLRSASNWTTLGRYVKGINQTVLDDVLRSRGIDPSDTTAVAEYLKAWDTAMAEQLYDGKMPDPYFEVNVTGAKPLLRVIVDSRTGKGIGNYKGMRIEIPKADMPSTVSSFAGMEQVRTFCEIKWTEAARNILKLDVRYDKGNPKYYLNGEEYNPVAGNTLETIQDRYLAELKKGDKPVPEKFAAAIAKHAHWASKVELFFGTAATVGMILDIEYSRDKQGALVRQLSLLGGALAGAKVFDTTIGNKLPYTTRFFANFVVSIIGATLGYEAIQNNKIIGGILDAVEKNIPGVHGISQEVGEIMYKRVAYKAAIKPLMERTLMKKALEKPVGAMMDRFAKSALRKNIGKIVVKKTMQNIILKGLGTKGPAVLAMFADDVLAPSVIYAPVALITDLIGAGLTVWSAYDIYEAYAAYRNAEIIHKELTEREKLPIKAGSVNIVEESVLRNIESNLSLQGLTMADLATNENVLFELIRQEPLVTFELEREGKSGKERWTMKNGEASKIEIYDENGKLQASMNEMDASNMEKAIHNVEQMRSDVSANEPDVADDRELPLAA